MLVKVTPVTLRSTSTLKFQDLLSNATKLLVKLKMFWSIVTKLSTPAPLWLKKRPVTSQSLDCVPTTPGMKVKSARHNPGVTAQWPPVSVSLMVATKDKKIQSPDVKWYDLSNKSSSKHFFSLFLLHTWKWVKEGKR